MSARRGFAACVAVLTLSLVIGPAQAESGSPYVFLRQLRPPTQGDQFAAPRSVAADRHAGEFFVCDTRTHRVVIFDERGRFQYEIRGGRMFRTPLDVAVDPEGYIVVLGRRENEMALVELDFDGTELGLIPLPLAPEGLLPVDPVSIAMNQAGDRLFVADAANLLVWRIDRRGEVLGSMDLAGGLSEEEKSEQVLGHLDVYGDRLLVAVPTMRRILVFDLEGTLEGRYGLGGSGPCLLAFPVAAGWTAEDKLLILDRQRALMILWQPEDNRCLAEYSGFGGASGAMYNPADLALDRWGRAVISQGLEGRVQVFGSAREAEKGPVAR